MIRDLARSPLRSALVLAIGFRVVTGWLLSTRPDDLNVGDPGQWIDAGDRILRGEWPYRDWTGIYGPLLYLWGALWYGLLGADWRAALLMLEVVSPVACLLLAAAAAKLLLPTPPWRAAFVLGVAALGLDAFYWSPGIRIWAPVAALAWAATPPAGRWHWLPFAACGLTPLLSPDTGLPCHAAATLLSLPSAWRGNLWKLLAVSLPFGLFLAFTFPMMAVWVTATNHLSGAASWIWGIPFPGDLFPFRRMTFFVPFVVLLAAALRLIWRLRRTPRAGHSLLVPDIALWFLCAGCLRSLLGRIDTAHLLFITPPLLLLGCRFAVRGPILSRVALIAGCLPLLWWSGVEGPVRRSVDAWRPGPEPRLRLDGEHVALPAARASHLARVTAAARPLLRAGDAVLSLPVPIYAHLLRSRSALPVAVPELLAGSSARALAALEAAPPSVAIVDPALALAWDEYFLRTPGGRLTWSTPADEPITRDLREHLRRWYVVRTEVDGARILTRRKDPLPVRHEQVVATIPTGAADAEIIARGDVITLDARGAIGDEIRTRVRFAYAPGLAGLAKSYTRLTAIERSGKAHEMVQPLPPAHLKIELRWPVPRVPLARILLEAGNPGTFNPDPRSATVEPLRLIRYGD